MPISTGSPETQTTHSRGAAALSLAVAIGIPTALIVVGLLSHGLEAIAWLGTIVWGGVATLVLTLVLSVNRTMALTDINMMDLLGSMFADPGSASAQFIGGALHLMTGVALSVSWAYTMVLFGWAATWATGMLWGLFVGILALFLVSSIGVVHPAIRRGRHDDPGTMGTNLGSLTPVAHVVAHLAYGFTLGILYQNWPLV